MLKLRRVLETLAVRLACERWPRLPDGGLRHPATPDGSRNPRKPYSSCAEQWSRPNGHQQS